MILLPHLPPEDAQKGMTQKCQTLACHGGDDGTGEND